MRILLTGFGPFGEVISNPTERLVRYFADREVLGHDLSTLVLPVSYRTASAMVVEAIDSGEATGAPFDIVWMLGVAAGSVNWRVERQGRNRNGAGPDAEGYRPGSTVVPEGPDLIAATVPLDLLVSELNGEGIPAIASLSAGDYLCNHVFYSVLWRLNRTNGQTMAGFLHVPPDGQTLARGVGARKCVMFEDQVRAAEVSLHTLVKY